MKNKVLKIVLSLSIVVGFGMSSYAQECNTQEALMQKMCYEKVATSLGEFIEYPDDAFFNDNEGRVVVRFSTNENSEITNVSVVEAPNKTLAKAVLKAVQLMALEGDTDFVAANITYKIPVDFNLNDQN
ncbi:TonB family protein [Flavobacteriaceae bacterium Ap0902]|nr:TonB family protein [Flavobacteriaceae bacterium Ap0902]